VTVARFAGFPDRMAYVPVPAAFFGTLLREIDSLGELKAALHIWRLLQAQRGALRFVRRSDLLADRALLLALRTEDSTAPERALAAALARAVARGTLLEVPIRDGVQDDVCYLLNTTANQRTARDVRSGQRQLGPFEPAPFPIEVAGPDGDRPGIFELYEQNVGLLTPLLAEELREAELTYPAAWIEDAFREAVAANRRSWRYVKRVLENWAARGRGTSGANRGRPDPPEDPRRYFEGKYGRLLGR
jgi:DNA replication protein